MYRYMTHYILHLTFLHAPTHSSLLLSLSHTHTHTRTRTPSLPLPLLSPSLSQRSQVHTMAHSDLITCMDVFLPLGIAATGHKGAGNNYYYTVILFIICFIFVIYYFIIYMCIINLYFTCLFDYLFVDFISLFIYLFNWLIIFVKKYLNYYHNHIIKLTHIF